MDTATDIHALRQAVASLEPSIHPRPSGHVAFGAREVDQVLGGGLARGALHEIVPSGGADVPAAIGLVAGLCQRLKPGKGSIRSDIVWLRERHSDGENGKIYPCGLQELGFAAERLILVRLKGAKLLLQAALEAAGCDALGAVVLEICQDVAAFDLTTTRKLSLLAERSGLVVLCLRAPPKRGASAAMTRWGVTVAPSRALPANAPGFPALDLKLLRHRMGPDGLSWRLEWNRDEQRFQEAPVSGAVVQYPAHRPAGQIIDYPWRRAG